ncbi:MAG: hypothetical protein ACM34J_07135 [Ignavibacteria bacterium]
MENKYEMNDVFKNKESGKTITIEFPSNNGCYYKSAGNDSLQFATFATLSAHYEKVQSKEKKFDDKFQEGYLHYCKLFKETPPAEWGKIAGNVGKNLRDALLSLDAGIEEMGRAISKFKTE